MERRIREIRESYALTKIPTRAFAANALVSGSNSSGLQLAQRIALPFRGKTGPLKSCDQVVGQTNYFQIQGVGRKSASRNLRQRIALANFPDASLHAGATIVEVAHPGRCQGQIRVPSSICITLQGKQSRLWITLFDQPSRHNATPCVRPTLGTMRKLRNLPAGIHRFVA